MSLRVAIHYSQSQLLVRNLEAPVVRVAGGLPGRQRLTRLAHALVQLRDLDVDGRGLRGGRQPRGPLHDIDGLGGAPLLQQELPVAAVEAEVGRRRA